MYGNRGVLHDADGRIVRRGQVRRWLVCELSFRGRRRPLLRPGRYTELFFLDEAVALAAGHRPCAECRYAAYREFRRIWTAELGLVSPPRAEGIDDVLHVERALESGQRRTREEPAATLPDGTFVRLPGGPHVVVAGVARPWSHEGYGSARPLQDVVTVLTPPSTLAVLRAGYRPRLHPTAM
ncbi:hypothetical protein [Pseudonocardia endophytica]|uniref:Metal binding Ada-like protein n=1 Tax=Pseudonocardia endophytica TaxID=401976 RepID=A0A4R1HPE2_PSEEN|nr:hypothetical protein [Pseudonocardia endophytica]TCK24417.1 hypothetical protein EV378_0189 [Pseudonocardia endophytica]